MCTPPACSAPVQQGSLSRGDLTATIDVHVAPRFDSVKGNFNRAVTNLRALIAQVLESATTIRTGSSEIAVASEDLAKRTEANAASLEETAAAATQMDQRLRATLGRLAASRRPLQRSTSW